MKDAIQFESMDINLRNTLWSATHLYYWPNVQLDRVGNLKEYDQSNHPLIALCQYLWMNYYKLPFDTLPKRWEKILDHIRMNFFECEWYEVYDFLAFIVFAHPGKKINLDFRRRVNAVLEREMSGYRFLDGYVARITDQVELDAIESAMTQKTGPVSEHMNRAVGMLSDRKEPDYRNSIKESISAVEAQTNLMLG